MKCIFLDIDGVLNSISTTERISKTSKSLGIEDDKLLLLKNLIDNTNANICYF